MITLEKFNARDCVFALCLQSDGTHILCIDSMSKLVNVHERITDKAVYRFEANRRFYTGV